MSEAYDAVVAREENLLCRSYSRYPLAIVRGKGSRLWDVDGKEYVDLLAGIAVVGLGHCNDEICDALAAQSRKLWHVSNLFYQEEQLDLAEKLLATTHHEKAFFCNSGAEANEALIKLARRYMVGMLGVILHVVQRVELAVKGNVPLFSGIDVQPHFYLPNNGYLGWKCLDGLLEVLHGSQFFGHRRFVLQFEHYDVLYHNSDNYNKLI